MPPQDPVSDENQTSTTEEGDQETILDAVQDALETEGDAQIDGGAGAGAAAAGDGDAAQAPEGDEAAGAGDGEGAAADVSEDEIDLEPPEGLSEGASERFSKLATGYRELKEATEATQAESAQVQEQLTNLVHTIRDTGASDEDFAASIEYLRFVKSDQPADLERALALLDSERNAIAVRLGRPLPGIDDPLSRHPDLREKVESLDITEEIAREQAMLRDQAAQRQQADTARAEATRTAQVTQQQADQASEAVVNALNRLSDHWKTNDIDFAAKMPHLQSQLPALKAAYYDPAQPKLFVDAVRSEWDRIGAMMKDMTPALPRGRRAQPISGGSSTGNAAESAPDTMQGAIERALGMT